MPGADISVICAYAQRLNNTAEKNWPACQRVCLRLVPNLSSRAVRSISPLALCPVAGGLSAALRCNGIGLDCVAQLERIQEAALQQLRGDRKGQEVHRFAPEFSPQYCGVPMSSTLLSIAGVFERCSSHSDLRSFTGFEKIRDATKIHCEYSEEYPEKWMEGLVIEGRSEQLLTQVWSAQPEQRLADLFTATATVAMLQRQCCSAPTDLGACGAMRSSSLAR